MDDLRAYDLVKTDLASGADELIPGEYVDRILAGERPLRVYRSLRNLTQEKLAEAAGVNRMQIADIEAGRAAGSVETVRKLAAALRVSMEDLV